MRIIRAEKHFPILAAGEQVGAVITDWHRGLWKDPLRRELLAGTGSAAASQSRMKRYLADRRHAFNASNCLVHVTMKTLDPKTFGPWAATTGASSGIGMAFARASGQLRFNLVLIARRGPVLEALAAELQRAYGIDYRSVALDLAEPAFLEALRKVTDALDVGLVVSNAGRATATELDSSGLGELESDVAVNVTAHSKIATILRPPRAAREGRDSARVLDRRVSAGSVPRELRRLEVVCHRFRSEPPPRAPSSRRHSDGAGSGAHGHADSHCDGVRSLSTSTG